MTQILAAYCINVTDIERSIEFWDGVMGIPLQSRTEIETAHEAVLQADQGGSRLQLAQQLDQDGPIDMGTALWKLYVNTSDIHALYAKAIAWGCESVMEPTRLERWPVQMAFIKDPDGYLIELIEHDGAPPPGVPDPKA
jgi:lactoylglutathione lyase